MLRSHPADLIMLPELRRSLDAVHPVDKKLETDAVTLEERCAEKLPDMGADAELLVKLTGQRLLGAFPWLDLAAGELPLSPHVLSRFPPRNEHHPVFLYDSRRDLHRDLPTPVRAHHCNTGHALHQGETGVQTDWPYLTNSSLIGIQ